MSANPPILAISTPAPHPNEHIHRYLASIHPLQPKYAAEGHERFSREQQNGFEEVKSVWANGNSSSLGNWSEVIMGKRPRAGSTPPGPRARENRELGRGLRHYGSMPIVETTSGRRGGGQAATGRARRDDDGASLTSSADRREQRRLRRKEKKDIRRPPAPFSPPPDRIKRHASRVESEASGSQLQYVPPAKRRKGVSDGLDIMANFEAKNVAVKRLTLKPSSTKGFLDKGASSAPIRPVKRPARPDPPLPRDEDWASVWRKAPGKSTTSGTINPPIRSVPAPTAAPRRAPTRPVAGPPSDSRRHQLSGPLPPPGRTNSSPWPSEAMSGSSIWRPHRSTSSRPAEPLPPPPLPFRFASPKTRMELSPFAAVAAQPASLQQHTFSDRANLPAPTAIFGEPNPAYSGHPSPPSPARKGPPANVENLATSLGRGMRIRSSSSEDPAGPSRRTPAAAGVQRPSIAGPSSGTRAAVIVGPIASTRATSVQRPLIRPDLRLTPSERNGASPSAQSKLDGGRTGTVEPVRALIHFEPSPGSTGRLRPPSPSLQIPDPIITARLDQLLTPPPPPPPQTQSYLDDVPHPISAARLDQLFTPPPQTHSYAENYPSPDQLHPERYAIPDTRFMSPRNPFLALPPTDPLDPYASMYDIQQHQHAFSTSPRYDTETSYHQPPPIEYMPHGYEAEDGRSFAEAYTSVFMAEEDKDEADLRNFWKDRPAIL